ncbi:HNH endonuclease [Delftia acidovorans SPH-1]|uniref:HNH endonuclease n=1 Tax=Delftia acidovorans (strain DSM 14801 / SPH-1) TaxID=398578 RepID=A9BU78_DELAS|nr:MULTISPECIES: HNH endonuclease signature motif containing protein [Delftia]ABX35793.1 HNH endonuclease [Delftia acidovorans SPH-1]
MDDKYKVFEDDEAGYHAWLAHNPNGFVLNTDRPPRAEYMPLHTARCSTIKIPATHARPDPFTSRGYMKVCANDPNDLLAWMQTKGANEFSKLCSKCRVAEFMTGSAGDSWTNDELRSSVEAYLEMQRKERNNEPFTKKQYYKKLTQDYGRTVKAFEYRMQNISYVLSLMGRDWLTGLRPARNVGKRVACLIEALVLELSNSQQAPVVKFEFQVRENLENKKQAKPAGNSNPGTIIRQVAQFERDPAVKAWVLKKAAGVCECCSSNAPFESTDGQPFLEVHHIRKLAEGGSDTVSNTVALCPNCHRALHYGMRAKELIESIFIKVNRLIRE